jgi:hypothetical protein
MLLFASENPAILTRLGEQLSVLPENEPIKRLMISLRDGLTEERPGPLILTDDKAPVELLGMRELDKLIVELLGMREFNELIINNLR